MAKGGSWGGDKVISSKSGDFIPTGKGHSTSGVPMKEMGSSSGWGEGWPDGSRGIGVQGVSGGGGGRGGSLGKGMPDGDRGWAKGV